MHMKLKRPARKFARLRDEEKAFEQAGQMSIGCLEFMLSYGMLTLTSFDGTLRIPLESTLVT